MRRQMQMLRWNLLFQIKVKEGAAVLTGIWILLAVCLLLTLLLMTAVRIEIAYHASFRVLLRVAGIPFRLYPRRKKRLRLSHYRIQRLRRRQKKMRAKQQKKLSRRERKQQKKTSSDQKKEKMEIHSLIRLVITVVLRLIEKNVRYLHIDLVSLRMIIATEDAAKTALLYGVVSQAAAYLMEILSCVANFRYHAKNVSIKADFASEKITTDIDIRLRLRVWQILSILLAAGLAFVQKRSMSAVNNSNHSEQEI